VAEENDIEIYERLTRIETDLEYHAKSQDRRDEQLEEIAEKLDALQIELSRYRGTVGGILLVVTAIVTALKLFGGTILAYFNK
jgi:hypothetical protein